MKQEFDFTWTGKHVSDSILFESILFYKEVLEQADPLDQLAAT